MNLLSSFTLTDGIILVAVLAVIALVIFFGFIKKGKKSGCKGCPYAKNCSSDGGGCSDTKKKHKSEERCECPESEPTDKKE